MLVHLCIRLSVHTIPCHVQVAWGRDAMAGPGGGAVLLSSVTYATLNQDWFSGNHIAHGTLGGGGAVAATGLASSPATTLSLLGCSFVENSAAGSAGGGLSAEAWHAVTVAAGSRFASNAAAAGGGLYALHVAQLSISNSTFVSNGAAYEYTAGDGRRAGARGGAVAV
jgi:hypothetical protein